MDANDRHAPTDDFIEYLARDIQRASRHQARFGYKPAPSEARGLLSRAKPIALAASVVVSLFSGVVLGASVNAAIAATPSASAFTFEPITRTIEAIGCAITPAPRTPAMDRRIAIDLPRATVRTKLPLASVLGVVPRSDGQLLINDAARRQIRLFDADLAESELVLDSLNVAGRSYASAGLNTRGRGVKLFLPFRGDSSLFGPDGPPAHNMLVLDAQGRAVRSFSMAFLEQAPSAADTGVYADARGRLIYRPSQTPATIVNVPTPAPQPGVPSAFGGRGGESTRMRVVLGRPDSLAVIRVDFATRAVDTVGYVLLPPNGRAGENGVSNGGGKLVPVTGPDGVPIGVKQVINPLVTVDDWAVLSDGTIAFVRGRDYHVDWIRPDGTRSSTTNLPFAPRKLTDTDKQRLIDSTRAIVDSLDDVAVANAKVSERRVAGAPVLRQFPYEIVPKSAIADHYPPVRPGAAKPDADGNLWILPTTHDLVSAGLVYDVVNPTDGFVRRVRLPIGRTIAGFGKGGVVFLKVSDPSGGVSVERTTVPALPGK